MSNQLAVQATAGEVPTLCSLKLMQVTQTDIFQGIKCKSDLCFILETINHPSNRGDAFFHGNITKAHKIFIGVK